MSVTSSRKGVRPIAMTTGLLATLVLAAAALPGNTLTLGNVGDGRGGIAIAAPRQLSDGIIVYARPPERPTDDGLVSARLVAPSGHVNADRPIGRFTGVRQVTHDAGAALVQLHDATGRLVYANAASGTISHARGDRRASVPSVTLGSGNVLYQAETDQKTFAAYESSGRRRAVSALPTPLPMTGPLLKDGKPLKLRLVNGGIRMGPLLSGPGSGTFAFVSNPENTVFANATSGARLDLAGYGAVYSAVVGGDGQVYALLHDGRKSTNTFDLVQIDPVAMTSKVRFATDVNPSGGSITSIALIATGDGAVAYGARLKSDATTQASILLRLDRSLARAEAVPLPDNLGLRATMGPDGHLYVFSGPAAASVSRVDLVGGQVSSVPWLAAPAGTYIQALFLR
jgi:hypothetical protein